MKLIFTTLLFYLVAFISALPPLGPFSLSIRDSNPLQSINHLEKRKGGGGGKGSGGTGSSGRTSSGGGSTSSGRPLSSYSFSSQSNLGGRTISGSGTPKQYGNKYTGGAVVPFSAGANSPTRNIAPYALGVGGLAVFPGIWLYSSVWAYPYGYPHYWYLNGRNHSSNVTCLCQQYQVCGCDPDGNSTFLNQVINNGTDSPVNSTSVKTVDYGNGSVATYINGSLANGTTADGGTEPSNESQISAAFKSVRPYAGYAVMVSVVALGIGFA